MYTVLEPMDLDLGRVRGHSLSEGAWFVCDHSTPSDDQFISPKGIFGRELGEVQGKGRWRFTMNGCVIIETMPAQQSISRWYSNGEQ